MKNQHDHHHATEQAQTSSTQGHNKAEISGEMKHHTMQHGDSHHMGMSGHFGRNINCKL